MIFKKMNFVVRSSSNLTKLMLLFAFALTVLVDKNANAEWVTTTTTTTVTETMTIEEYEDAPPRHEEGPQEFEREANDHHGNFRGSSASSSNNHNYNEANKENGLGYADSDVGGRGWFLQPEDTEGRGSVLPNSCIAEGSTCLRTGLYIGGSLVFCCPGLTCVRSMTEPSGCLKI